MAVKSTASTEADLGAEARATRRERGGGEAGREMKMHACGMATDPQDAQNARGTTTAHTRRPRRLQSGTREFLIVVARTSFRVQTRSPATEHQQTQVST
jgi:hypothetical protein